MAKKKAPAQNKAFQKLKADLEAKTLGNVYIFYGEETYLREHYLKMVKKALVSEGFEAFNFHAAEGRDLNARALAEMAEAMPVMAERTMIAVTDYDLFKLSQDEQAILIDLLSDVPPYCCIVFVYDTVAYKPNRSMKKLCKALDEAAQAVEFKIADSGELTGWVARHYKALGKDIDRTAAEHLIFTCGGLMTGLSHEIDKIAAYTKGPVVTLKDIDTIADPVLSAEVFRLSDAVAQGNADKAASILGDLLKMQTEPIVILAALGSQLRRIWTARIALDSGRDKQWLMDLWGMRSEYPAKLLLSAARGATSPWCADAVQRCQTLDRRMKSQRGLDAEGELKLLLAQLEARR